MARSSSAVTFDVVDRDVTEANRRSWNLIAHRREAHFPAGGETLAPFERELAGNVEGRHVVHLACSFGDEVLAWAGLGARATGVDISDVAIEIAVRRARQAKAAADFRCADMGDLPDDLVDIDLFHLSWGAICWVGDLGRFAVHLAGRLRPGGAVLLCDHHPVWEVLAADERNNLTVAGNYFGRRHPNTAQHRSKRPAGAQDEPFQPFVWPVSDVVMAFVNAGLRLDAFFEAPEPRLYHEALPAYYVIKATSAEAGR
jgi:SAM-dependent methyltransferase